MFHALLGQYSAGSFGTPVNNFAASENPRQNAYPQGPSQSHGTPNNGQQQQQSYANNIPSTPEAPRQSQNFPQQSGQQLFGFDSNEAPRQGAPSAQNNQGYPRGGPTQVSSSAQNFGTPNIFATSTTNSQQNFGTPNNFPQSAPTQGYGTPNQAGQSPVPSPTFGPPSSQQTPSNFGASQNSNIPPIAGGPIYVGSQQYASRQATLPGTSPPVQGVYEGIRPIKGSISPTTPTTGNNAPYPPAGTPSGARFPAPESNNQNNFNAAANFVDPTPAARAPSSNYGTPTHRGPSGTPNAGGQGYNY